MFNLDLIDNPNDNRWLSKLSLFNGRPIELALL